ncbi:fatty acyl-CoA reductase wat-like [Aricia agestis]|uniref:fatty acyl-CoA reductase wat-like n=1 Tax=Aricia agestis TaxID=91739 RepID=UPI001C206D67|nr:fatty acyl-CoA reductase wat-like [Aricia agestis]XP_041970544.1 fatty acyl-CoA reductase wat-like [Aricia agestis]
MDTIGNNVRVEEAVASRIEVDRQARTMERLSDVQTFYEKKNILITGATGFLGKVLMEKLLRRCQGLENLYILVRQKRGQDIYSRVETVFEDPLFDRLKEEVPKFRHKVVVVQGDCDAAGLGLNITDRQMLIEKVNVIFHSAATVKFDEHLRRALITNVRATRTLVHLAREMTGLTAFMHISTAFGYPFLKYIDERVYPCNVDYDELQGLVDNMTDDEVDAYTDKVLDNKWPNTYTYTKAMTENELLKNSKNIPLCIFRPAIVSSTTEEPVKSWVDNMYGATGVAAGCMTGVLRSLQCDPDKTAELVPVDYVVNCLLVASLHVANLYNTSSPSEPPVYNFVTAQGNKLTWNDFRVMNFKHIDLYPTTKAIWYRTLSLNRNYYVNLIYVLFLHTLPALLVDIVVVCLTQKPKMLKVYRKIHKFSAVLAYFSTRQFKFSNEQTEQLWEHTSTLDKKLFPFDMRQLDWEEYFKEYLLGIRRFLLKEKDETIPQARIKIKRLYYLHQLVLWAGMLLLLYLLTVVMLPLVL